MKIDFFFPYPTFHLKLACTRVSVQLCEKTLF
jgi:hypothetical protein